MAPHHHHHHTLTCTTQVVLLLLVVLGKELCLHGVQASPRNKLTTHQAYYIHEPVTPHNAHQPHSDEASRPQSTHHEALLPLHSHTQDEPSTQNSQYETPRRQNSHQEHLHETLTLLHTEVQDIPSPPGLPPAAFTHSHHSPYYHIKHESSSPLAPYHSAKESRQDSATHQKRSPHTQSSREFRSHTVDNRTDMKRWTRGNSSSFSYFVAPQPVQDTPEVAMARHQFLWIYNSIKDALTAHQHQNATMLAQTLNNHFQHSHDHHPHHHHHAMEDIPSSQQPLDNSHHQQDDHQQDNPHQNDPHQDDPHQDDHHQDNNHLNIPNAMSLLLTQTTSIFPDPMMEPELFLPSVNLDSFLLQHLDPALPRDPFVQHIRSLGLNEVGGTCYEIVLLEPEIEIIDDKNFRDSLPLLQEKIDDSTIELKGDFINNTNYRRPLAFLQEDIDDSEEESKSSADIVSSKEDEILDYRHLKTLLSFLQADIDKSEEQKSTLDTVEQKSKEFHTLSSSEEGRITNYRLFKEFLSFLREDIDESEESSSTSDSVEEESKRIPHSSSEVPSKEIEPESRSKSERTNGGNYKSFFSLPTHDGNRDREYEHKLSFVDSEEELKPISDIIERESEEIPLSSSEVNSKEQEKGSRESRLKSGRTNEGSYKSYFSVPNHEGTQLSSPEVYRKEKEHESKSKSGRTTGGNYKPLFTLPTHNESPEREYEHKLYSVGNSEEESKSIRTSIERERKEFPFSFPKVYSKEEEQDSKHKSGRTSGGSYKSYFSLPSHEESTSSSPEVYSKEKEFESRYKSRTNGGSYIFFSLPRHNDSPEREYEYKFESDFKSYSQPPSRKKGLAIGTTVRRGKGSRHRDRPRSPKGSKISIPQHFQTPNLFFLKQ